ncbi:MAG: histidinol-phosphatase [Gammaproteobacteria bacterium]|nr:histidinol-phosphatase [Gammaproteobacteria bacterium]
MQASGAWIIAYSNASSRCYGYAPVADKLLDDIVPFALQLADTAREIVLRNFRRRGSIEHKRDLTPVTATDREVEQHVRERIADRFPSHGVRGEEFPDTPGDGEHTWVLDPIDGTKGFITGKPLFGTLIALLRESRPVLGIVDIPVLAERWLGVQGRTATLNGNDCTTSAITALPEATIYASSPDMFSTEQRERFDALCAQTRFRCFGADCYAYGLLASGHTELVVEADMRAHDYMALVPVIENAGGVITDWYGEALQLDSNGTVLAAANQTLHQLALASLKQ